MLVPNTVLQQRYLISHSVGQGGMGTVYQAVDQRLGNIVAVKELIHGSPDALKAFEREARLLARLRHPALPKVIDYFDDQERHFLVMEFIPGLDLGEMLARRADPFEPRDVLRWADQLLDALEYLHAQTPPILHRDIKPQNLKTASGGSIILLDFGLAKGAPLTGGSLLGYTLNYASPEQIHGEGTDQRSDLYSLAATVYDLLTGVRPVDAVRRAMALAKGHPDILRSLHELSPAISPALGTVLHRALALDPHVRYPSATELRVALRVFDGAMQAGGASQKASSVAITETPPRELTASDFRTAGDATVLGHQSDDGEPLSYPTGTVTFLFAALVESSQRWEQFPQTMPAALARYDALLRTSIAQHRGMIFRSGGGTLGAAFALSADALAAAWTAQRALFSEHWEVTPLQACLAIHTDTALVRAGDYFGPALNRVTSLLDAGHGGQILLSQAAEVLVRDHLPTNTHLIDLGEHRLKDLSRPERVFQLTGAEVPLTFPELKTLDAHVTNLPAQPNPLIGREEEVAAGRTLLQRPDVRLVTCTGPGGAGKTRLSLQVAADLADAFADGVFFVGLATSDTPDRIIAAIAQAFDLKEEGEQTLKTAVHAHLHQRHMLLVLDNFEHLIAAASVVSDLLAAAPLVKVLVTSREALRISGEYEFPVPPLGVPNTRHLQTSGDNLVATTAHYPAIALFVARAQAARPDFALTAENALVVAEICARLDGLPLAIELAAARSKLFAPRALLARLTQRLKVLTGGARDQPTRQQTLQNTIDWSYNLLTPGEQLLLGRLAVFVGGCSIDAAETICHHPTALPLDLLDGLESLVNKSLLQQAETDDGEPCFTLLETLQEYALGRLHERGDVDALWYQHAMYYLAQAEQAEPQLSSNQQVAWLDRLEHEHDNLRAALNRSVERGWIETAARVGGALWRFWFAHGHLSEGRKWLDTIMHAGQELPVAVRAKVLNGAGALAWAQNDYQQAQPLLQESLALFQALGDQTNSARALNNLGMLAQARGAYDQAQALYEEGLALFQKRGDQVNMARVLNNLGIIAHYQGENQRAITLFEQNLALQRTLGERWGIADSLLNLGVLLVDEGNAERATLLLEESLSRQRELNDTGGIACSLTNLGRVAMLHQDVARAVTLYLEGIDAFREIGDRSGMAECLEYVAAVSISQHQLARAVRQLAAADVLRREIGTPRSEAETISLDQMLHTLHAAFDDTTFAALWTTGQTLSLEQIVTEIRADNELSRTVIREDKPDAPFNG